MKLIENLTTTRAEQLQKASFRAALGVCPQFSLDPETKSDIPKNKRDWLRGCQRRSCQRHCWNWSCISVLCSCVSGFNVVVSWSLNFCRVNRYQIAFFEPPFCFDFDCWDPRSPNSGQWVRSSVHCFPLLVLIVPLQSLHDYNLHVWLRPVASRLCRPSRLCIQCSGQAWLARVTGAGVVAGPPVMPGNLLGASAVSSLETAVFSLTSHFYRWA